MSPDGRIKPPPEEKLLRLIRAKPLVKSVPSEEGVAGAPSSPAAAMDLLAAAGRHVAWRQLPWPKMAAAALSVALGVEALWLLVQLVRPLPPVGLSAVQDAQ